MRSAAIMIPSAINPSPTMEISTSIVSRLGICLEVFMVLRLLAPATSWTGATQIEVRQVTRRNTKA
jgi:hypothetical protein